MGIHRNPTDFPSPDEFKPERYLAKNRLPYPHRQGYSSFGFGRRVCSGQALAEQGLFITIARLLWAFDIKKALDGDGKEMDVDTHSYTNGELLLSRSPPLVRASADPSDSQG